MKSLIHKKETKKYKVWYQFENNKNNEICKNLTVILFQFFQNYLY